MSNGFWTNLLFPRRCPVCGEVQGFAPACSRCGGQTQKLQLQHGVGGAHTNTAMLDGVYALYRYEEPVRGSILRMKSPLAKTTACGYAPLLAQRWNSLALPAPDWVLSPSAYTPPSAQCAEYCSAQTLARQTARLLGVPYSAALLYKRFATRQQKTLSGSRRRGNLLGAYACADTAAVQGKTVLLIDDLVTTGSTLNECACVLRFHGAQRVYGLCVASADDSVLPGADRPQPAGG